MFILTTQAQDRGNAQNTQQGVEHGLDFIMVVIKYRSIDF